MANNNQKLNMAEAIIGLCLANHNLAGAINAAILIDQRQLKYEEWDTAYQNMGAKKIVATLLALNNQEANVRFIAYLKAGENIAELINCKNQDLIKIENLIMNFTIKIYKYGEREGILQVLIFVNNTCINSYLNGPFDVDNPDRAIIPKPIIEENPIPIEKEIKEERIDESNIYSIIKNPKNQYCIKSYQINSYNKLQSSNYKNFLLNLQELSGFKPTECYENKVKLNPMSINPKYYSR